jgi:hypothetical protein
MVSKQIESSKLWINLIADFYLLVAKEKSNLLI